MFSEIYMSPSILADVQEIEMDEENSGKKEELDEFSGIRLPILLIFKLNFAILFN